MHTTLSTQIDGEYISSFHSYNVKNEKHINCAPTNSMTRNFLNEIVVYFIAPSQNFHPLHLFKYQHSKELNFPTLFYGNPRNLTIFFLKIISTNSTMELLHKSKN
jgi:hypothetical protein